MIVTFSNEFMIHGNRMIISKGYRIGYGCGFMWNNVTQICTWTIDQRNYRWVKILPYTISKEAKEFVMFAALCELMTLKFVPEP